MNLIPAIGLALALGAPGAKDAPKSTDAANLVGEWVCIKFVGNGQEYPDSKQLAAFRYEFDTSGKVRADWGGEILEGTYTTDTSKNPAHLDFAFGKTDRKGRSIFKADKDTLTICSIEGSEERPARFESPSGRPRYMLMTFTRVQKKK